MLYIPRFTDESSAQELLGGEKPKKLLQGNKTNLDDIYKHCEEVGECMEWQRGYGNTAPQTSYMGKQGVNVRRVVAQIMGTPVEGKLVTNTCGNPRCVRSEHVRVWTKKKMMDILSRQKRLYSPTRAIKTKAIKRTLNAEQITQIMLSTETQANLAKRYKMTQTNIARIKQMRGYRGPASVFTWIP